LRVVGVDRNHEPQRLEPSVALSSQDDAPVDELPRGAQLDAVADAERSRERAVAEVTRRIARVLQRLGERERAGGTNGPLEGQRLFAEAVSASTPRSYARRRMGSASSSRPRRPRKFAHSSAASPASVRRPCAVRRSTARRYASFAPVSSPSKARP